MRHLACRLARRAIRRRTAAAIVALAVIVAGLVVAAPAAHADNSYRITLGMNECGVMAVGVTGTCIVSLQTWLNIFDDAGLVVDGRFGPATRAAVIEFQRRHGLLPDGRFGNASRNALRGVYQYMMDNSVATPRPGPSLRCNPGTGVNCDVGGVVPGAHGGIIQTLSCTALGRANLFAGVFCDVWLQ